MTAVAVDHAVAYALIALCLATVVAVAVRAYLDTRPAADSTPTAGRAKPHRLCSVQTCHNPATRAIHGWALCEDDYQERVA